MMSVARKSPSSSATAGSRRARLPRADAELIASTLSPDGHTEASTTGHIVAAVTRAIVEHRLLPGAKLVEQKLGDSFGVSRTVVRQALYRLSELKLVRLEPARGAFIAAPSVREAREVFAVRKMVESQMLRDLIACIKPADIRALKAHIKAERDAVQRVDVPARTKLLFDFHVQLASVLGNQVLVNLMQELVSRCSLISLMYQSADNARTSNAEHAQLLHAIEARDVDTALKLLHAHLDAVASQIIERPRTAMAPLNNEAPST